MHALLLVLACSGGGPAEPPDADRDGVHAGEDCDDGDPFVHPGAIEVCNGRDDDCDGDADGGAVDPKTWYDDPDGDGYASNDPGLESVVACDAGPGWARVRGDCADRDPAVHPDQPDGCNDRDDDCDGELDEDPDQEWFVDADRDGAGDGDRPRTSCGGDRRARTGDDCDDDDPAVFPNAPEVCNGVDDDCDGAIDDDDAPVDPATWYPDQDLDGVGVDGGVAVIACVPPNEHWATVAGDCDDLDILTFPGAVQRCDGVDNDCDGQPPDETGWWDPAWPYRVPLEVTGSAVEAVDPILVADVDFRGALDAAGSAAAFDPATLTVVVQRCDGGARVVPAAFSDELSGLLDPVDPTDPLDERGTLHVLLDEAVPAGATLHLAAYFGGPAAAPAATLSVDARGWSGPLGDVTIDPDRGGLLDDVLPTNGANVLSQADAPAGNGSEAGGVWLSATSPGSTWVVAPGPSVAAVAGDGDHSGPDGAFRYRTWWWGYAEHPAVYGKILWETTADTTIDDLRPFQATAPGLPTAVGAAGPGWVGHDDGVQGSAFGWVRPPATVTELACDATSCWTAASELAGPGVAPAGTVLVDHRVLVVLPAVGDPALPGLLDPPAVTVGAAQVP